MDLYKMVLLSEIFSMENCTDSLTSDVIIQTSLLNRPDSWYSRYYDAYFIPIIGTFLPVFMLIVVNILIVYQLRKQYKIKVAIEFLMLLKIKYGIV